MIQEGGDCSPRLSACELFIQKYESDHEIEDCGNKIEFAFGAYFLVAAFLFPAQCLTSFPWFYYSIVHYTSQANYEKKSKNFFAEESENVCRMKKKCSGTASAGQRVPGAASAVDTERYSAGCQKQARPAALCAQCGLPHAGGQAGTEVGPVWV